MSMNAGKMKMFVIDRAVDVTGISGTGIVAEGMEFSDGIVVLRWLGETRSTVIHASIENVEKIHCHNGNSVIHFLCET